MIRSPPGKLPDPPYRVSGQSAFSVSLEAVPTTFTVTLTPDIPPGAYQLQVIPLGADGTPGTPSAPLAFSLVPGVALQTADRPFFTAPEPEAEASFSDAVTVVVQQPGF